MGIPSILSLFFLLHLLFLHSSGKCPDSFNCGTHGQLSFPLSNTTFSHCGIFTVQNCTGPVPKLNLGAEGSFFFYDLKSADVRENSIRVNDPSLGNLITTRGCDIFSFYLNWTLPVKPSISFTISPGLTLFKCTTISPELDKQQDSYFHGNDSYRGCSGYTVYYKYPHHYPVQSNGSFPPNCSVIELPVVPKPGNRNTSDLFSVLASEFSIEFHVSKECLECRHKGERCGHNRTLVLCEKEEEGGRCNQDSTHFGCKKEKEGTRKLILILGTAMAKKRTRQQNPEPFLADDSAITVSKKRHKPPKHHQHEQKLISSGTSSKILKEALIQQKEIKEENEGIITPNNLVFAEEPATFLEEEDINDFGGFLETQSHFGGYEEEVNEEDEKLLEAFISKNAGQTLADLIVAKIKQKDAQLSSEVGPLPKLDESYIDQYKRVGEFLNKYTAGKIPKSFKHIPSMQLWEEVLYLTEPEKWSPTAVDEATRIFASNLGVKKAERFYKFVLFPRIREDIRKNKRLHFALCQALKKSVYKPGAFYKGILFPLCESGTCNKREAKIIGSIIQKVTIPPLDSSAALLRLAEMDFCGTTW